MRKLKNIVWLASLIAVTLLVAGVTPIGVGHASNVISTGLSDYRQDETGVVQITLNGNAISVEGNGVTVNGSTATIVAAGTYSISGSLTDGQIVVNAGDEDAVQLILNGASISSSTSAPIYVENAAEVMIMLQDNTENYVSDGSTYVFASADVDEPNAAIFSSSDLTISGNGTLAVAGNYNDGIASKDGLVIDSGIINVNAVDDGIRGKDYIVINAGTITVNAQGDGLKSDNDTDAAMGYITIENGVVNVIAGGDAIQAQTNVLIDGGAFALVSGGGSGNSVDETTSAKGIKGTVNVTISGGTLTIDSADDGIHSNGDIVINGGTFSIASGDDGMHADGTLTINDGTIDVQMSYEGIEATDVIVNGGTIDVIANDDGINGAGGNDSGSSNSANGFSQDNFSGSQGTITINDGVITIAAAISGAGDGLDANGTITINGGDTVLKTPSSYRDYSSIDYVTGFSLTGGSVRLLDANGTYSDVTESNVSGGGGRRGKK